MTATADVFGDRAPFDSFRCSTQRQLEERWGDLNADQIQELADHFLCPEEQRFLRETSHPAVLSRHFAAQSAIARWCVNSVIWLVDRATPGDPGSRGYRVLLRAPLFCGLMILRTVIHTFHRSQKGWASLLGHIFARRLDKSSKTRRTATDPGSGVSLPPPAEPPPEAEEDEGEESPV